MSKCFTCKQELDPANQGVCPRCGGQVPVQSVVRPSFTQSVSRPKIQVSVRQHGPNGGADGPLGACTLTFHGGRTTSEQCGGQTIRRRGASRPRWSVREARQDAVVVCDFSSSMIGRKAQEAWAAVQGFTRELAALDNHDCFRIAIVKFAAASAVLYPLTNATWLQGNLREPSEDAYEGGTNITAGLESALEVLKSGKGRGDESGSVLRPVCLLFSDGGHNFGSHPSKVAAKVKEGADLVTVAFGTDADEDLLRVLATSEQHFYRCADGRDLRHFMAIVGTTMTQTRASGINATVALSSIRND